MSLIETGSASQAHFGANVAHLAVQMERPTVIQLRCIAALLS
jgi:hypothetical protein